MSHSQLTIVTGPPGVDIGTAVARIGKDIADGLAVRVIDSIRTDEGSHTSPDPHHRRRDERVDEATAAHPDDLWITGEVRLRYLPSAWQDPQTNLGVVFTAHAHSSLKDDLHTMAALGLDPSHRLTVQALSGILRRDYTFPAPIEVGDVGVHARDAVLRAGGHVLIEAGGGMTHLEALAALRLAPWSPWIGRLDLWTVFDADAMAVDTSPGETLDAAAIARRIADGLTQLGALADAVSVRIRSHVAITGVTDGAGAHDLIERVFGASADYIDTVTTTP